MASASSLSNRKRYANFQRTIPPDTIQASVIIQLLKSFNWSYVSVVYTEGVYGEEAFDALDKEATKYDVCFAHVYEVKATWSRSQYQQMVYELARERYARIVVVLTPLKEAKMILEATDMMSLGGRMTWIAGDAWLRGIKEIHGSEVYALGSFSVNIDSESVPRFDQYFQGITPESENANPWISEYWEKFRGCSPQSKATGEFPICDNAERFSGSELYAPEVTVSLVYDAVYTFAHALDMAARNSDCVMLTDTQQIGCIEKVLRAYMDSVRFQGETDWISYTDDGYIKRDYIIYNIQNRSSTFEMVEIGHWDTETGVLNISMKNIQWAPGPFNEGDMPISLCSYPCGKGEEQVLQQKRCCWSCEPCDDNQRTYLNNGIKRCATCRNGTWPDQESRTM